MKDQPYDEPILAAHEEARIEKRDVVTGRVVVETKVEVADELVRASLEGEVVEVVRVPKDTVVTEVPAVRTEGDEIVVPVVEEVLVVEKRLVLKEELRIRRRRETEEVELPVTLRRQRVEVRRDGGNSSKEPDDGIRQ